MFKKSLNIALLTLAALLLTLPAFADSQVRIVRLSQVDGDVQADRNTGQGFEKAFLNMPVTQGMFRNAFSNPWQIGRAHV